VELVVELEMAEEVGHQVVAAQLVVELEMVEEAGLQVVVAQ
jgi:hypothetical protein